MPSSAIVNPVPARIRNFSHGSDSGQKPSSRPICDFSQLSATSSAGRWCWSYFMALATVLMQRAVSGGMNNVAYIYRNFRDWCRCLLLEVLGSFIPVALWYKAFRMHPCCISVREWKTWTWSPSIRKRSFGGVQAYRLHAYLATDGTSRPMLIPHEISDRFEGVRPITAQDTPPSLHLVAYCFFSATISIQPWMLTPYCSSGS